MKKSAFVLLVSIALLSILLTGCTGNAALATSWPGVSADAETAYLANNSFVYAINLTSGAEKWRFPAERDNKMFFYAAPAIAGDGQLIVGGYDHIVYSLNPAANGQQNWAFSEAVDRFLATPATSAAGVFAPSSDGNLYALTSTGQLRWTFDSQDSLWASPVVDDQTLFQASMDHSVTAINVETGNTLWNSGDLGGAIAGTPTLDPAGRLYAGTFANEMVALDTSNGEVLWRTPASNWVWSGPALVDDVLYYGDIGGIFYAVDAPTGTIKWQIQPDTADPRAITGRPLVVDGKVFFGSESGTMYAVDAENGTIVWSKPLGGKIQSDLVAAGDSILVALNGSDTVLVAINFEGTQRWAFIPAK